jgi:tRNA A-37 threonylcarbamoyl transferase component Bud32
VSSFDEAVRKAALDHPHREVFAFEHEGRRYWLKRGRRTGSNLLHRAAWRLIRLPLLTPVKPQSPAASVAHESGKLTRLRQRGICVPRVLARERDFFVMEDTGPTFRALFHEALLPATQDSFALLFDALGRLHRMGEYHGGSQIRNFTYRDGRVCLIDFEENFDDSTPLRTLQFRDLFLLMFSLAKDRLPVDWAAMAERYSMVSGNEWVIRDLRDFAERTRMLERIITLPPLWRILDKDTKATYRLIRDLKRL